MKTTYLLIIILFSLSSPAISQGKYENGLKIGIWTETYTYNNEEFTTTGAFKIIPQNFHHIIQEVEFGFYRIKNKKSTTAIFFEGCDNGYIDVKHGLWKSRNKNGSVHEHRLFNDGILLWTKVFDRKANLTFFELNDFENDSILQYSYISGELFKKAFYGPLNKNKLIEIYYPNDIVSFSDGELHFNVNLISNISTQQEIKLFPKKDVVITRVISKQKQLNIVSLNSTAFSIPQKLKANQTSALRVSAKSNSSRFDLKDTLLIYTTERKLPYQIFASIRGSHINGRNVDTLSSFQLSKSRDKYLVIQPMGTVTEATLKHKNGKTYYFDINSASKIDLTRLQTGIYNIEISSCNNGGQISMNLIK